MYICTMYLMSDDKLVHDGEPVLSINNLHGLRYLITCVKCVMCIVPYSESLSHNHWLFEIKRLEL
jgi:hypothetical protein